MQARTMLWQSNRHSLHSIHSCQLQSYYSYFFSFFYMQPYLHYLCSYCCQTCIVFGVDVQEHLQVRHHQQLFCCESRTCRPGVRFTYGYVPCSCLMLFLEDFNCTFARSSKTSMMCQVSSDTASQFSPSGGCGVKKAALRIFSRYSNANFEITKEDLPEVLGAMATMIIVESPDDHRENH